nr:MAG TPA: hypothetical protein [Caudoviricetes sp.]
MFPFKRYTLLLLFLIFHFLSLRIILKKLYFFYHLLSINIETLVFPLPLFHIYNI